MLLRFWSLIYQLSDSLSKAKAEFKTQQSEGILGTIRKFNYLACDSCFVTESMVYVVYLDLE